MNNIQTNKPRRTRVLVWVGIVLFCLMAYSASFMALRKHVIFTLGIPGLMDDPDCAMCVTTYYFSENDFANRVLYHLFQPIHRIALKGRPANEFVGSEFCDIPSESPDFYWESSQGVVP